MKYLLMLVGPDRDREDRTDDEIESDVEAHLIFHRILQVRRVPWSGGSLYEPSAATTLRRGISGELLVTDGPYAELDQHLSCFYVIDVKDLREAIEIAKLCPMTPGEAIEIRPIYDPD
jgi:hypothetical protein